ncbi:MAG: hypothetical protein JW769_04260 [Parachlamydiales bacterium]|nr:hypothetical protein [Parachlamydiales bacterium]
MSFTNFMGAVQNDINRHTALKRIRYNNPEQVRELSTRIDKLRNVLHNAQEMHKIFCRLEMTDSRDQICKIQQEYSELKIKKEDRSHVLLVVFMNAIYNRRFQNSEDIEDILLTWPRKIMRQIEEWINTGDVKYASRLMAYAINQGVPIDRDCVVRFVNRLIEQEHFLEVQDILIRGNKIFTEEDLPLYMRSMQEMIGHNFNPVILLILCIDKFTQSKEELRNFILNRIEEIFTNGSMDQYQWALDIIHFTGSLFDTEAFSQELANWKRKIEERASTVDRQEMDRILQESISQ